MSRSEELRATEVEVDYDDGALTRDVITADRGGSLRGNPLSMLPLLIGVLILVLDAYLLVRLSIYFFQKNLQGGVSFALIVASIIVGIALIAYALGLGRLEKLGQRVASPLATWVGIPLLMALVALGATVGGMELNRSIAERATLATKPCIEVFQQAQAIAKDNPRFRMPATDRDEVRCAVNAALGR